MESGQPLAMLGVLGLGHEPPGPSDSVVAVAETAPLPPGMCLCEVCEC